jgi:hypothetical protein
MSPVPRGILVHTTPLITEEVAMPRKFLALALSVLLVHTYAVTPLQAGAQTAVKPSHIDDIRSKVAVAGVSSEKLVQVRLKDGTKLKGHITAIQEDSFDLALVPTGEKKSVLYSDVSNFGSSWSSKKVLLIVGVAVGTLVAIFAFVHQARS